MARSGIAVIGAPVDLGQSRRGVDMGVSAIRVAGLDARLKALGYSVSDLGNIPVVQAESAEPGPENAKYLAQIAASCDAIAGRVEEALEAGNAPVVVGGDHSVAVGTVAGVSNFYRKQDKAIGLLWVDAHADMNTPESSPSGNVHGMPLACCIGLGPAELVNLRGFAPKVNPENVVIVGLRNVDETEKAHVRQTGVTAFTMRDIDERGLGAVMNQALDIVTRGTAGVHVSLDMDWVDPQDAPGVGTPVRGGATYREAHLASEMICDFGKMLSIEVVEVNPVFDESNRTADLAVELIMSAFGKRIL
jgi:arginase